MGDANQPVTFNKWLYANSNPLYYIDSSGEFPLPIFLILIALGIIGGTSGCTTGPEPDVCRPLPPNLQPDAISKNPREQSLQSIKDYFGIQLPPPVTYVDISHISHSTSYSFVYAPYVAARGYTPWFTNELEGEFGTKWGDVAIMERAFTASKFNAYDIADTMVHEAFHAWEQYTLVQLAQNPQSTFMQDLPNHSYFTYQWGKDHNAVLEYEASSYALQHAPDPLCTSVDQHDVEADNQASNSNRKPVVGLEQSPWPMSGYPLP